MRSCGKARRRERERKNNGSIERAILIKRIE